MHGMKSIEELRAKTIPLPCAFAGEAGTGEVADFPTLGTDTDDYTSYQSGFPEKFATTVSHYKVNTSVTSSENTEWASMDDKVEPVVEEYKSKYAYSAGDSFLKRDGANRTSFYSVISDVTAEENDGIKSIMTKLREITCEYSPHVGYVVGDLFCRTFPQDHDILRKDMNKFGELATAELHFKESGLSHKFRTPGYIVTASISAPENTGWDKMIDKTALIFDVYKTGTAYSIGDCFQWTKEKDSLPYVFYKVTTAITATDNTGWDAMDGKVVEISDRYSAGVEYNVGAVFLCEFRYPFQCLFGHFDGKYIKHIESQSRDNAVNFTANPLCIDNYVSETAGGEKKVFWKTVDKIYGLDEDLFRLEVDYSRVDKLQPTDTLKEDSLIVIGDYGYPGEGSVITPASASLTLTVGDQTIEFENKGKCGIKVVEEPINDPTQEVVITGNVPYPKEMCGYGNSTVVFYAKKGTAVSYKFDDGQTDSAGTNVFAFPVILKVGKASGGIQ